MDKTAAIRLSEKEYEKLEMLKKAYDINNTSELIRMLIRKDYTNLMDYEGLRNLSDKQIFPLGLYNNSIILNRKELHKDVATWRSPEARTKWQSLL